MSVDRTAPQRLTFPPERRVRRKVEFEAAYKRGRRFSDGLFIMTVRANEVGGPRLGLAIAALALDFRSFFIRARAAECVRAPVDGETRV